MKNFLVLGCMLCVCLTLMALNNRPQVTLVKSMTYVRNSERVAEFIKGKIREGYTLTHLEGANNGEYDSTWVIVMEK